MINLANKKVKITKVTDTKFDGKHPNGIVAGSERIGTVLHDLVIGESFYMTTDRGGFLTSTVTSINDDMTFNTKNSVYKIELLDDVQKPTLDNKNLPKPVPGRLYIHYKGGIYDVLHLAKHTTSGEELVIYKSVQYGTYYARPLVEWFDVIKSKDQNGPEVKRFEIYNG